MPTGYSTASGKSAGDTLGDAIDQAADLIGPLLYREAQGVMAESQGLVPVDTGTLRASGFTAEPQREGDTITVELGYGGPAAKVNPKSGESVDGYAIIVHEDMEAFHKVGMAKFLEAPLMQAMNGMEGRIAEGLRSGMAQNAAAQTSDIGGEED